MASEQFHAVVGALRANGLPNDVKVDELRALMESWTAGAVPPEGVTVERVDAGGVPAEWVRADGARSDAALLYLHGGGYCIGSPNTHRNLAAQLSRRMCIPVLLLDYRLAPEHPHPAAVEDATTAYRFLLASGIAPERLAVAGDSAGGGLTFATLVALRDDGVPLPAAAAAISPWTDLACNSETYATRGELDPMCDGVGLKRMADWFLAGQDPRDPLASPRYADLNGLPPVLVHVGDHEVLLTDSTAIAERARAAGVDVTLEVWPEMIHVWHAFVGIVPESDEAVGKLGTYLESHLSR
jgi:epsilon-lactone hydrolase